MSASVLTSAKLSGSTALLTFPSDFIAQLQNQVIQQGDVIRDLRYQIQRWNVEGAEWTRSKLDMRQLVDLQKGEVVRLRGEVVCAMTRAEKAEEGHARMAETAKKAVERESMAEKEAVERESELRRELQVANQTEVELTSTVELAKDAVKATQSEIVQLRAIVERDVVIMRGVHEEKLKLQSKAEMLEMQRTQADAAYQISLNEAINRMQEVEDEKTKQIREVEDEKMKLYGELEVMKAESLELKRRNRVLEERFSKRCDEEEARIARLKEELETANAEVVELKNKNEVLREKLHNGRQALSSRANPVVNPPAKATPRIEPKFPTSKAVVETKVLEKRKAIGARADTDFFAPPKKRRFTVSD